MYKTRLKEPVDGARLQSGYVEMDPSGRFGRFRDALGKGAMKTVYKAFDEVLGMEVAWNQVKLNDIFRSPNELQRLYSEVHLLKSLNHDSIIKFYAHWIDCERRTFNFITEMLTSGTLRQYRQKYKRVNVHAVKKWARQILNGLVYLHGYNPPVIHRDLKCDNIFVNGHLGQVKIGDLGLAAILKSSHHAHSVIGTPEFMAPELYEEDYNELVDIYSFGMCMIEMLTTEYPYSECSNPAQIYKKVTSGKLPEAIQRIEDVEARNFVKKCLQNVDKRPSAQDLLEDPFLKVDDVEAPPAFSDKSSSSLKSELVDLPVIVEPELRSTDMTITGTMDPTDDTIFLKVKISHKDGQARNVYFPFDIMSDTAIDVATEMVKELEISEWEPFEIAEMINEEISALVPSWKHENLLKNQDSFNYNDDDDDYDDENRIQNPFYSHSFHSSSQASLPGICFSPRQELCTGNIGMTSLSDWFQEDLINNDDDKSSQTSLTSHNYSSFNFFSANENDYDLSHRMRKNSNMISSNQNSTKFYPKGKKSNDHHQQECSLLCRNQGYGSSNNYKKLSRVKSLVDIRSQLLHKSLVEEVQKRCMFKTVGAVENIGFKEF